jgi:hypothetical protein
MGGCAQAAPAANSPIHAMATERASPGVLRAFFRLNMNGFLI